MNFRKEAISEFIKSGHQWNVTEERGANDAGNKNNRRNKKTN